MQAPHLLLLLILLTQTTSALPPPKTQACTCTVVFGNKAAQSIAKATVNSTIGLTGEDKSKKAGSADLLVGSGCVAAVSNESVNSCVTSQSCTVA
ncbi:uncharacterized protein LY89DRAFT_688194 [Mollisia scopiformis]|uniref:Uncharacterized protein n=1 Tax=Mollisia scopiformis TaxID=149040 RepID=A0A194WXV5_MOLSC|nr:uncharacterized protein LY89DRAFT_688194 [Mollisia scopiformis]KUJ12519.1 hypothetical protein LY89DRAFT_688194 [Mollisia scopiformis]